ncbi:hypothetical protein RhiJN_04499 [Ceratobasidium sp. AG-Ba]|nr:hypothetical protein RhiJN_04499 [Ceratobasidium sp. AG-Ba]QRW05390.1 hypothetical protein RhiLY_04389 [Ceratobasidium sp. AG-Ba]
MAVAPISDQPQSLKKDKKNKNSESAAASVTEKKKQKKRRNEDDDSQLVTPVDAHDERSRKRKKVEQKDPSTNDADEDNDNTDLAKPKRPKRPKDKTAKALAKNSTDDTSVSILEKIHIADISVPYTNPLTDTSLPELSRRGLAYAYQYAQHISLPSDAARRAQQPWKFNKGRQNWIIRNVTEPSVIPDGYLALAMVYIESIMGGARDALRKTCKTTKKRAKAAAKEQVEAAQPKATEPEGSSAPKQVAFAPAERPILDEEKRKRAKKILRVLKGKVQPQDV